MEEKEVDKILQNAYAVYSKNLISEMFRYTRDYDLAEDCVQDALCVLQSRLCERDEKIDDIQAFMFSVAKNAAQSYSAWHSKEICLDDMAGSENVLLDDRLKNQILDMENKELVEKGLSVLSPLSRKIFVSKFLRGLSYAEIGRSVGMSSEAVRKGVRRIREQLRNEILNDERGEIRVCLLMKVPIAIF